MARPASIVRWTHAPSLLVACSAVPWRNVTVSVVLMHGPVNGCVAGIGRPVVPAHPAGSWASMQGGLPEPVNFAEPVTAAASPLVDRNEPRHSRSEVRAHLCQNTLHDTAGYSGRLRADDGP